MGYEYIQNHNVYIDMVHSLPVLSKSSTRIDKPKLELRMLISHLMV